MSIFKAYDIRGPFGDELTLEIAHRIGRCLTTIIPARRVLVGRDARQSSPLLAEALCRGLTEAGCDVDDMGLATTPMVYCFTARHGYDLSVQITASHNPPNHGGFKISRRGAVPVGGDTGLDLLRLAVGAASLPPPAATAGKVRQIDLLDEFLAFLKPWRRDLEGLDLAIDCSDGMASLFARDVFGPRHHYLADVPDGTFPSHAPNPMLEEARRPLADCIRERRLDVGVIFDGDVDRVMFLDDRGTFVRPDLLIPVIAGYYLRDHPGATVLHDIRTSRGVVDALRDAGARTVMWKVGHAFAKVKMRESNAIFGGELAGHYYFRDFFWCDSGELAAMIALGEIAAAKRRGLSLQGLLAPYAVYANTGELNYHVSRKTEAMEHIRATLTAHAEPDHVFDFDGYRIEYPEWWLSIRPSNTEPYLRLIIEARDQDMLQERRDHIERLLADFID